MRKTTEKGYFPVFFDVFPHGRTLFIGSGTPKMADQKSAKNDLRYSSKDISLTLDQWADAAGVPEFEDATLLAKD